MAISYFDSASYLTQKLAQLQEVDPSGELNGGKPWTTTEEVSNALAAQGFTPESHFEAYGKYEDLSPVKEFVPDEYYALKAEQLNAMNGGAGYEPHGNQWTAAQVKQVIKDAGLSAWDHYVQYGSKEGVSPSNSLDEGKYLQAKAEALNAGNYEGRNDWTPEQVKALIEQGGMTVLDHYEQYAGKGDMEAAAIPDVGPNPYEVDAHGLTLTTADDVFSPTATDPAFRTTAGADLISGEVNAQSKTSTLNAGDQIDGGAGRDTLDVAMANNFTGFTTGSMKNVEVVNLTNATSRAYSFSAANMEGVEEYNLKGAVNLKDLASTDAAVNVIDLASGSMSVAYAADAVKGTEDALNLGLSNAGTVGTGNAEKAVSVTAAGIETLNVTATGDNVVSLSGVKDATAMTVAGDGSLKVTNVAAGVKNVDASAAIGALNLDLSAAKVESVRLGSGDDKVILKDFMVDATLEGGAGTDEVVLNMEGVTAAAVKQPQMTGVETLTIKGAAVKTTISGADTTGLETVKVQNLAATTGEIVLAEMHSANLNVAFDGASAGTVAVADDLALTINMAGDTAATVSTGITAATAPSVSLNVDGKMSYTGTIAAAAATEVNIALGGDAVLTGAITADKATDVTLASTSSQNVVLASASSFAAVQNLSLSALADVTIVGVGGGSQSVAVDGTGVKGNLTLGVNDTAVDEATVVVNGSNLGVNTITVEEGYDNITVTGGIQKDIVTLADVFKSGEPGAKSLNIDLGIVTNDDQLILGHDASSGITAAETFDFTGWEMTLDGVDFIDAASAGAILTMAASAVASQEMTLGSTGSFAKAEFTGTEESDVIDFSGMTGKVASLYIKAGDGDDVITIGSAGTDDYIMGGNGADSIYLAGGTGKAHIQYEAKDATDMISEGDDRIYDFTVGASGDVIDFAAGLLVGVNNATINVSSVYSTDGALQLSTVAAGSTGIYAFTCDMEAINTTAIAEKLSENGHTVTVSSGEQFVFAFDDGADTYLYLFADADGANTGSQTVDADELHLIGILEGVSDAGELVGANFSLVS